MPSPPRQPGHGVVQLLEERMARSTNAEAFASAMAVAAALGCLQDEPRSTKTRAPGIPSQTSRETSVEIRRAERLTSPRVVRPTAERSQSVD